MDNGSPTAAKSNGTNQWTFTPNLLKLKAGTHTLNVVAYDANNKQLATYSGSVLMVNKLHFDLGAALGGATVDASDLRFIRGVPANVPFTGTIAGLAQFYQPSVQIKVGAQLMTVSFDTYDTQNETSHFHFSYNVSPLKAGTTNVPALVGGLPLTTKFGDTPENLTAIALPSWLKVAKTDETFDAASGDYQLDNAALGLLSLDAKFTQNASMDWITSAFTSQDLATYVHVTPILDLSVPLNVNDAISWTGSQIQTDAKLFGTQVWQKDYSSDQLSITGQIDGKTLEPKNFSMAVTNPVPVFNSTLFDVHPSMPLAPHVPKWLFDVELGLDLTATATVSTKAGIMLNSTGTSVRYVPSGTFLNLTTTVQATATLTGTVSVLSGWVGSVAATGTLNPTLTINAAANFAGALTSIPKPSSYQLSANLVMPYDVKLTGDLLGVGFTAYDSATDGNPKDKQIGPYELFTLGS